MNDWKEEWVGMPEYVQEKEGPYKEILVKFDTKEDMDTFYELIGQKAPNKLKSIYFPKKERKILPYKEFYVDKDKKYPVMAKKYPVRRKAYEP